MKVEAFAVLVDEFEAWLRVPKVSWAEWKSLDKDAQAALLVAAKRIEVERAVIAAKAAQGNLGAAQLMAEIDDGQSLCELVTSRALDSYQRRMKEPA